MAIFSRKKQTTAPPPSQSQSTTLLTQPANQYAIANPPSWTYVQQQPNTSRGNEPPSSQGWLVAPIPPQYQPVFVQQSYSPPVPQRPQQSGVVSKYKLGSVTNLLAGNGSGLAVGQFIHSGISPLYQQGTQYVDQGAVLCELIASKFDNVITLIDGGRFSGDERELVVYPPPQPMLQQEQEAGYAERGVSKGKSKGMVNNSVSSALTSTNYFAKVNLYANSRLPPNLPPLKLYVTTYPLLCLAVQYSERVYAKPSGQEKEEHVDSDWRHGTKAMVIKSVPMDDMNTIVFAIRGTQTFMDWAVNLNSVPASPEGFLDDPGNFCHAGFLSVAKKMIKPVAARLRHLLEEDPGRSKCSLLITGHSAGGAVAALLYSHMLATNPETESELNILTGCFKRVHCVTFGAPPTALLPLAKPPTPALRKSIFLSFVNEGDPVARADKAYVRSLLDLYATPAPGQTCLDAVTPQKLQPLVSGLGKSTSSLNINKIKHSKTPKNVPAPGFAPVWPVPEAALSNAGRIVLLRSVEKYETRPNKKKQIQERMNEGVVAQIVTDELLRGVVWGDPVCHMMSLYARRIEVLATNAVMGRS
ncbi:alpha/beta-hydrolase [Mollisia scopiformis]|uniref:Alpha/beta-hydrolase n=1 Tax=Mollisia scopiformis TaxID=149040 RepID=A0A194XGB1_MOLSC|nr:alpha/beta-hydrolase [Mollisia scopiformis]KUJ19174.1 alpha/beta-hydrolase [Mollisia scopiformis]